MIIRTIGDVEGADRDVYGPDGSWTSKRFILKKDGFGFSLHESTVLAGRAVEVWYKNHLEAVYVFEGEGEIEDVSNGEVYELKPQTLYALHNTDKAIVRAKTDMKMVSVFNPPIVGNEVHDEEGAYPILEQQ
jgi:L-ectoine synthase